jgi:hypothetical protein
MKNYITEEYIKGFIPELAKYLWHGEADYSKQKEKAEQIVLNDFLARGYRPLLLQNDLLLAKNIEVSNEELITPPCDEDKLSRMRFVYEAKELLLDEGIIITLEGSNELMQWSELVKINITSPVSSSVLLNEMFKYYRLKINAETGSITCSAYLTETTYDLFFAYKWLQLILEDSIVSVNDGYMIKAKLFEEKYSSLWANNTFFYNKNVSGFPEAVNSNELKISRG